MARLHFKGYVKACLINAASQTSNIYNYTPKYKARRESVCLQESHVYIYIHRPSQESWVGVKLVAYHQVLTSPGVQFLQSNLPNDLFLKLTISLISKTFFR